MKLNYSLNEIQNYINENKLENPKSFEKFNRKLYCYCYRHKLLSQLKYTNKRLSKNQYSILDIQKIIDNCPDILIIWDFKRLFPRLYEYAFRRDWIKNLKFKEELLSDKYNSIEKIQEFIETNNIQRQTDFQHNYPSIWRIATISGFAKNLKYGNWKYQRKWYNTFEDFQNFINSEKIESRTEFLKYYYGLYEKSRKLDILSKLEFKNDGNRSLLEIEIKNFLLNNNRSFEEQKRFSWLSRGLRSNMSLDFYLADLNLAIECQGYQHFISTGRSDIKDVKLRDIEKYNLCKSNGITVFYYVNPNLPSQKYHQCKLEIDNYFAKVYTSTEDLLNAMNSLI